MSTNMDIFKTLFFTFIFLLHNSAATTTDTCPPATCNHGGPEIHFPFRLKHKQPNTCGYPGFTLSCDNANQTVLSLPTGKFLIQGIDYSTQEIWINDYDLCLPKKILKLNLTNTPFTPSYYQKFTFFNCSLDYTTYNYLNPIGCLSNQNYTVFATSSRRVFDLLSSSGSCNRFATVQVPVGWPFYGQVMSSDLGENLRLSWSQPMCSKCERKGQRCGFMNNSSSDVGCYYNGEKGIPKGARIAVTIGVGLPALLCSIGILLVFISKLKSSARNRTLPQNNPTITPQPTSTTGLDMTTIQSYPKIVLGESRRLPKPDDNTCPICLCEYNPKETLKTIPECSHCFHADCIDEWLQLNASCPICRNSPGRLLPEC